MSQGRPLAPASAARTERPTTPRRAALLEAVADHLLSQGLAGATLRPMAAAAGTSDRMLVHHFGDRDRLIAAALRLIADRLQARLDASQAASLAFEALLTEMRAALSAPELRPVMALWLEVAAASGRGREPFRTEGGRIADIFLSWTEARLEAPAGERRGLARRLLALLDGLALLDAVGRGDDDGAVRDA